MDDPVLGVIEIILLALLCVGVVHGAANVAQMRLQGKHGSALLTLLWCSFLLYIAILDGAFAVSHLH